MKDSLTQRRMLKVRILLLGFIAGLVISGVTAFPVPEELRSLTHFLSGSSLAGSGLYSWLQQVRAATDATQDRFPFLFYGYDWLAFAHLVIALLFIGPLKDPVRNIWVIEWGMAACALVIPLALICGPLRGIPFFWQLIDCSFGVVGIVPLILCRRWIRQIAPDS